MLALRLFNRSIGAALLAQKNCGRQPWGLPAGSCFIGSLAPGD
jgi:hypothetical protein